MTDQPHEQIDRRDVPVVVHGVGARWQLSVSRRGRNLVMSLDAPQTTWTATGGDVFGVLMELREQLDLAGIQVCCNGARRNAWASGMQRDMGMGVSCYLLDHAASAGRPPSVKTLDEAPPDEVGTVEEQKAFYAGWLARRAAGRN